MTARTGALPASRLLVRLASSIPKTGEAPDECQDACDADADTLRFAVSDGTTESFFPGQWARLLASRFCHGDPGAARELLAGGDWLSWLRPLRQAWRDEVRRTIATTAPEVRPLFENRFRERHAAGATFTGIVFDPRETTWRAVAVGDSCLFQIRDGALIHSHPLRSSGDFSSLTEVVSSVEGVGENTGRTSHGHYRVGDVFVLATDALAHWLFKRHEEGGSQWRSAVGRLTAVADAVGLDGFVRDTRRSGDPIADDDVTAVVVCVEEGPDPGALRTAPYDAAAGAAASRPADQVRRGLRKHPPLHRIGRGERQHSGEEGRSVRPEPPPPRRRDRLVYSAVLVSIVSLAISTYTLWRSGLVQTLTPGSITIQEPSNLYAAADASSARVLRVRRSVAAPLRASDPAGVWYPVELKLWVQAGPHVQTVGRGRDSVRVTMPTPSRLRPGPDRYGPVGRLMPGRAFKVAQVRRVGAGVWYLLRVPGYVRE